MEIYNDNNDNNNSINIKKIKKNKKKEDNEDNENKGNKNINLNEIVKKNLYDNKILIVSICSLFAGYWFQDIMFSRKFSMILTDIPSFVKDISVSKILSILFPYLIAYFLFFIDDIILAKIFPKMETNVINELLEKILESLKTTKNTININELMLNLKSILDIKNIYNLTVVYLLPTVIIGFGLLYYFFKADKQSLLIIIGLLALFILLNVKLERKCINISQEHEQNIDKLYDEIQDIMVNSDTVITSNTKKEEMKNVEKYCISCSDKHEESEIVNSEVTFGLSVLSMVFMFVVDGIAVKLFYENKVSSDILVTLCMLSYTFTQYYNSSVFKFKNVMHYISRYKELNEYFKKFKIENKDDKLKIKLNNGNVIFKQVQPKHENTYLQKKINIEIKGGTKVGIIGEIGTGKTSILKILAGLKNYKGEVYVDQYNFKDLHYDSITNNIIYISQHPKLFNRTIFENISYGTKYSKEEILNIMKNLGIKKFFDRFEKGIYSNVGKEGGKLSGGQKQIVALIRAIIHQKKIILLDEPTSSLDSETKSIFTDLIQSIKDKTIIVVTHDKTIYDLFDDIIELK